MRERLKKYRQLAEEAERKAATVDDANARSTFQGFAAGWRHLANQVEAALQSQKQLAQSTD